MERHYKKAPIQEVVCEFNFKSDSSWDLTVPGLVYNNVQDIFPKKRELKIKNFILPESGRIPQLVSQNAVEFFREDGRVLVRLAENYLRVSHLPPYSSWQEFFPLIQKAFVSYNEIASSLQIEHLSLRYINRIEIPKEELKLEEYFNVKSEFGLDFLQTCIAFIAGGVFLVNNKRNKIKIQLTDAKSKMPGVSTFMLDLEYFFDSSEEVIPDNVVEWIDRAHTEVIRVFEGCITEKLRELFEGDRIE